MVVVVCASPLLDSPTAIQLVNLLKRASVCDWSAFEYHFVGSMLLVMRIRLGAKWIKDPLVGRIHS